MGIIIPIIIIIVLSAVMQSEKAKRQKSNSPAEKKEKTQRQNPDRYAETAVKQSAYAAWQPEARREAKQEDRIFAPHERYRENEPYAEMKSEPKREDRIFAPQKGYRENEPYAEMKSEPKREDRIFAPHERYRENKSYKPEAEKIQSTGIIEKSGAENFLASTEKLPLTVQSVVWAEVLSEPKAMQ